MQRLVRMAAVVMLLMAASLPASAQSQLPNVTVVMVHDGPGAQQTTFVQQLQSELDQVLAGDYRVDLVSDASTTGDFTHDGLIRTLEAAYAVRGVDLVVCSGAIGSAVAHERAPLPVPTLAAMLLDPEARPEVGSGVGSGLANLTYVSSTRTLVDEVLALRSVVPDLTSAVVLASDGVVEAFNRDAPSGKPWRDTGLRLQMVRAGGDAASALAALPADCQAVFLPPLIGFASDQVDELLAGLRQRKLPTSALEGESMVERGALMGTAPREWMSWVVRRCALNARKILAGDDPALLPVELVISTSLFINMGTARAIDVAPPFATLVDAVILDDKRDHGRTLDLRQAIDEAVATNRDLLAEAAALDAARAELSSARANLLPRITAQAAGTMLDEDRAAAALRPAERSFTAGANLTVPLWNEDARLAYNVQKRLLEQQEATYEQARLDVVAEAAMAYLQVLRALTAERIQRANLMNSRQNLESARLRARLGVASRAEELRWRSQIATEKSAMIDAQAQRNLAEIELNRVLDRPLEEHFIPEEPDLEAGLSLMLDPQVSALMTNSRDLRRLRSFAVQDALDRSPELAQLDAGLAAQRGVLASTGRAFYVPDVALSMDWSHYLDESGAGSETRPLGDLDDTEWSATLAVSLPLFDGGRRFSDRTQAGHDLLQLREQRQATAQRIEQRVRSAVHSVSANYAAIDLSRQAAEASRENLELINDSYARGAVDLITLLDAQSVALQADLAAADAVYAFLLDLMETERSVGAFTVFADADGRRQWLADLEAWFANQE